MDMANLLSHRPFPLPGRIPKINYELQGQLNQYVDTLMLILLNEETPRENQTEILDEIKLVADVNGKITITLNQISQRSGECDTTETSEECIWANSLWIKTQSELIRRKQTALDELRKREKELGEEFWVDLAFDGVIIVAGTGFIFCSCCGTGCIRSFNSGSFDFDRKKIGSSACRNRCS